MAKCKRGLALFLAIVMCLSMMNLTVFAAWLESDTVTIYLYAKLTGDGANRFTHDYNNGSGYITVGTITISRSNVNGMPSKPDWTLLDSDVNDIYGVRAYVNNHKSDINLYSGSESLWSQVGINVNDIDWSRGQLRNSRNADSYDTNGRCWHIDVQLEIKRTGMVTVYYLNESREQIKGPSTTGPYNYGDTYNADIPQTLTGSDGTEYELSDTEGNATGTMAGHDVIINAYYKAKTYAVTYNWNGDVPDEGDVPQEKVPVPPNGQDGLHRNDTYTVSPKPDDVVKEDEYRNELGRWVFDGWKYNGSAAPEEIQVTGDITLTGTWSYKTTHESSWYEHQVFYQWTGEQPSDLGDAPAPQTFRKGASYTVDTTYPERTEHGEKNDQNVYTFGGWYEDEACTKNASGPHTMGDTDVTFYGLWKKSIEKDHFKPDLVIIKKANGTITAGEILQYTITVANKGEGIAYGVEISDNLPADVIFFGCSSNATYDGGTVTAKIDELGIDESVTVNIWVTVDKNASGAITNTAKVKAENSSEKSATAEVTVKPNTGEESGGDTDGTFTLTVTKEVKGNPPQNDTFEFEVIVDGVKETKRVKAGENFKVEMKEGQKFSVTEVNIPDGYTAEHGSITGTAPAGNQTVTVTNTYEEPKAPEEAKNTFELHYHYNAGATEDPKFPAMPLNETVKVSKLSYDFTVSGIEPALPGYTFLGWATTADATVPEFHAKDTVIASVLKSEIDLYAVWAVDENNNGIADSKETYILTVSKRVSGTGADLTQKFQFEVSVEPKSVGEAKKETYYLTDTESFDIEGLHVGDKVTVKEVGLPDGYTSSLGEALTKEIIIEDHNVELKVINHYTKPYEEEIPENTFAVRYHYNAKDPSIADPEFPGMPKDESVTNSKASHTFTISGIKPYCEGYVFLGWATEKVATAPEYIAKDALVAVLGYRTEFDLYAVWAPDKNGNGIDDSTETYSLTVSKRVSGTGADPSTEFTFKVTPQGETPYTKTLKDSESFTIEGLRVGTQVTVEEISIPAGYTSSLGDPPLKVITIDDHDVALKVINRYEKSNEQEIPENTFALHYHYNASDPSTAEPDFPGMPKDESVTVSKAGHDFTVSGIEPALPGYTFLGWATTASATAPEFHSKDTVIASVLKSEIDLYAVWAPDKNGNGIADSEETYTLTVSKRVSGTGANKSDVFTFKVTRNGTRLDDVKLSDGGSFPIEGLSVGDQIIVEEINIPDGYTSSLGEKAEKVITIEDHNVELKVINRYEKQDEPEVPKNTFTLRYHYNPVSDPSVTIPASPAMPKDEVVTKESAGHDFVISGIEPSIPGYTFLGWATTSTATTPQFHARDTLIASIIKSEIDLYAVWVPDKNGNGIDDSTETYSLTIAKHVVGTGADKSMQFSFEIIVNGKLADTPYVADGKTYAFMGLHVGDKIVVKELNIPKDYTSSIGDGAEITISDHDVTLNVINRYETEHIPEDPTYTYTLVYNANGGTFADPSEALRETPDSKPAHTFNFDEAPTPTREGYIFLGWGLVADGTVPVSSVLASVLSPSKEVYAIWAKDENGNGTDDSTEERFNVTYTDGAGGTVFEDVVFSDRLIDTATPEFTAPARKGYLFKAWTPVVAATVTENATYTATWSEDANGNNIPDEEDVKYTLTYEANGGSGVPAAVEYLVGTTAIVSEDGPATAPKDCLFVGWSELKLTPLTAQDVGTQVARIITVPIVSGSITMNADRTLHAVWAEDKDGDGTPDYQEGAYLLTYDGNAGNETVTDLPTDATAYINGTTATLSGTPAREGYVFLGWSAAPVPAVGRDSEKPDMINEIVMDANKTVYAVWALDSNGDDIADVDQTFVGYTIVRAFYTNGELDGTESLAEDIGVVGQTVTATQENEATYNGSRYTLAANTSLAMTLTNGANTLTLRYERTTETTEPGTNSGGNEPGTNPGGTEPGTTPGGTEPGTTPGGTEPGTTPGGTEPGTTPGGTEPGTTPGTEDGPTVDIPDDNPPLSENPEDPNDNPNEPPVDIPDENPPLTDDPTTDDPADQNEPADDPTVDIPDENPPLAEDPTANDPTDQNTPAEDPSTDNPADQNEPEDDPTVDIPDENPPLAEDPTANDPADQNTPAEDFNNDNPADQNEPEDDPTVDIPDENPPLGEDPGTAMLPDEQVPMDGAPPQTGDTSIASFWMVLFVVSALGLVALFFEDKRKVN